MSPMCKQMTREPYGSVNHAATIEEVVAEADSPTPSPTPPATPSPPPLAAASPPLATVDEEQEEASRRRPNCYPLLQDPANDCLPIDHNLPQMLRQVTGHSNLKSVRELRLRVISREMSLQRLSLFTPNLREINLDGSCLGSLRDLGCALSNLQVLRVARCGLDSLDGVLSLGNLRELHASENHIDDVAPCSSLPNIRIIDLRRNTLSDISYLQFLDACTHLQGLILAECPAASRPGYRAAVRRMLPQLMYLDETPLSPAAGQECSSINRSNVNDYNSGEENMQVSAEEHENLPSAQHTKLLEKPSTSYDKTAAPKAVRFSLAEGAETSSSSQKESTSGNEMPSLGAIQKRPASSASNRRVTQPTSPYTTQKKPRPLSASATENGARCDSPSALTSGNVVCGNLTAALRNRRKRCEAWGVDSVDPRRQSHEEEVSTATMQELAMASGEAPESHQTSSSVMEESEEDLLQKSRKWREQYKLYRDEHRDRWKKEEEEVSDEKAGGEEPTSVRSVSSSVSTSKRGSKPTCCPHLFAPKKETSEDGTSNNKRTSHFPPKR